MTRVLPVLVALTLPLATAPPARGEEHEQALKKDLFTVIALEGEPCGEVVEVQRLGESDYVATCRTGARYRVRITPAERVSVEPIENGR